MRDALVLLALAACATEPSTSQRNAEATALPTARLAVGDLFLPFRPGFLNYALDRGTTSGTQQLPDFGITNTTATLDLDTAPLDNPDLKRRLRVTLEDVLVPYQDPRGTLIVHGAVYTRSHDPMRPDDFSTQYIDEPLEFNTNGQTRTTVNYFDAVTSITIDGPRLNLDAVLTTAWYSGHEQEIDASVVIAGPTNEVTCETGWKVLFNGQEATPLWDAATQRCAAGLIAGAGVIDGESVASDALRGVYFPVNLDDKAADTFHHYHRGVDFVSQVQTWSQWLGTAGAARPWFDVTSHGERDTRSRPLVIQLVRLADHQVIDAARTLVTIERDAAGNPSLVAMQPDTEMPGAIAQLSSRGLHRLEPVHAATLPYPIVPAGTQPRLSQSAIAVDDHMSQPVSVRLDKLPAADLAYWTQPGAPFQQFAGQLAYEAIRQDAHAQYLTYFGLWNACSDAACRNYWDAIYCVHEEPETEDFTIRIDQVRTRFDPARPDDALVIGDVTHLDLAFDLNRVFAKFLLEDIQGWLDAWISPADIRITYSGGPLLCATRPPARTLQSYMQKSGDPASWLTCKDLSFAAGSGSLGGPFSFNLVAHGEQLDTPFAPGEPPVSLAGIATDPGTGICDQPWMSPTILTELAGWQADTEITIKHELVKSPGEDEALNRLLSPYELGVPRIDAPPPETPAYSVHPLSTYELSARIAKTSGDAAAVQATKDDGLYLPYLTRTTPLSIVTPFPTWFCPVLSGQLCNGLSGYHEPKLVGGRVPDGSSPYDVAINYTTAHLNQALWAQARLPTLLGSPLSPVELAISESAVATRAAERGYGDVTAALARAGSRFAVRYHHEAAPYTLTPDITPPRLLYATQNMVVELVLYRNNGTEAVVAKMLVDVIDYDHRLAFQTGGGSTIAAAWGDRAIRTLTTTYLDDCYDAADGSENCNVHLQDVVLSLWTQPATDTMLDLLRALPALQLFDAGQESAIHRHLTNPRTYLVNQGVVLVGDLCPPGSPGCP